MKSVTHELITDRVERLGFLDPFSEALQNVVRKIVPQESQLKDVLSGTWLGHPLHPLLTDTVIGTWMSAQLLDLLGGRDVEKAADGLVAAGVLAAVPTAASGLSDWADTRGTTRRIGHVHAFGNTVALALHAASLAARRRGERRRGVALSRAGFGVATFSAWLGGALSFDKGVGVNQTAFERAPEDWTPVLDETQLVEGQMTSVEANGAGVLLVRKSGRLHALGNRCSHRGCPLHRGTLNEDETVTCFCHGSTFRLDGSIVKGPATSPQPSFQVRASAGKIEIAPQP